MQYGVTLEGVTITGELILAAPPPAQEAVEDNGDLMESDDEEEEEEGEEAGEAQEEAGPSNKAPRVARGPSKAALARAAKEEELKARIVELEKQLLDATTVKLSQSQSNRARLIVSQPAQASVFGQSAAAGEALRQRLANDSEQIRLRAEAMQGKKTSKVQAYVPPAAESQKPPPGPSGAKGKKGIPKKTN